MNPLKVQISSIDKKINVLLKDYDQTLQSNFQLEKENQRLEGMINTQQTRIAEMEKTMNLIKMTRGETISDNEKSNLDELLDQYIKEIDKCIAVLSRQ